MAPAPPPPPPTPGDQGQGPRPWRGSGSQGAAGREPDRTNGAGREPDRTNGVRAGRSTKAAAAARRSKPAREAPRTKPAEQESESAADPGASTKRSRVASRSRNEVASNAAKARSTTKVPGPRNAAKARSTTKAPGPRNAAMARPSADTRPSTDTRPAGRSSPAQIAGSTRRLISSSGRYASAGRILGVALLCFGLWTLLDANQMYHEAVNGGADGTRRNVAIAVLRPIAAISNALHLSGLVNFGNTVLNRNGGPGNSQGLPPPVIATVPSGPNTRLDNGRWYLPHGESGHGVPLRLPTPYTLPPVPQPTTARPLTILDIGDSIGEDLGFGLGDLFSGDPYVHVLQEAVEDTGLVQSGYYNWPGHLQLYLNRFHPGAVIVMMGANDDQNLNVSGHVYTPGSAGWTKAYTARVDTIMAESTTAGAHVLWVGLPPMGGGNITNRFVKAVNSIFQTQAALHHGVTYVGSWKVFAGPKGQFEVYLKIGGSEVAVRSTDGVHLDPAGWDLLAKSLVVPMERTWGINLHVTP